MSLGITTNKREDVLYGTKFIKTKMSWQYRDTILGFDTFDDLAEQ